MRVTAILCTAYTGIRLTGSHALLGTLLLHTQGYPPDSNTPLSLGTRICFRILIRKTHAIPLCSIA